MKKKLFSVLLCASMIVTLFAGCGGGGQETTGDAAGTEVASGTTDSGKEKIRVMSFTDEVPNMIQKYIDKPEKLAFPELIQ